MPNPYRPNPIRFYTRYEGMLLKLPFVENLISYLPEFYLGVTFPLKNIDRSTVEITVFDASFPSGFMQDIRLYYENTIYITLYGGLY